MNLESSGLSGTIPQNLGSLRCAKRIEQMYACTMPLLLVLALLGVLRSACVWQKDAEQSAYWSHANQFVEAQKFDRIVSEILAPRVKTSVHTPRISFFKTVGLCIYHVRV
jgi:hypothetical protein